MTHYITTIHFSCRFSTNRKSLSMLSLQKTPKYSDLSRLKIQKSSVFLQILLVTSQTLSSRTKTIFFRPWTKSLRFFKVFTRSKKVVLWSSSPPLTTEKVFKKQTPNRLMATSLVKETFRMKYFWRVEKSNPLRTEIRKRLKK